jgi:hypothetical protein
MPKQRERCLLIILKLVNKQKIYLLVKIFINSKCSFHIIFSRFFDLIHFNNLKAYNVKRFTKP